MNDELLIEPVAAVAGSIRPPGSKSITNRALVCAALAEGRSVLQGALDSDDTRVMVQALRSLGLEAETDPQQATIAITGGNGQLPRDQADLFVGNSGTTVRFLTAMLTVGQGRYRLDGVARMRQRPIGHLIETLRQLGAQIHSQAQNDCPPVVVHAQGLQGGQATIRGDVSSQFLSGVLMAAPYAARDVTLLIEGPLVSQPYVHMTCQVMQSFGVHVEMPERNRFQVAAGQRYQAQQYLVEPDASAASYFWAAAAITGGTVTVQGLTHEAMQGDVDFCNCLRQMGCAVTSDAHGLTVTGRPLRGIEIDMNAISDTVQTLAAVALFAEGPTTITNVAHIRHKETDRIGDLARELRKLGAQVTELEDGLRIQPASLQGATIETYDDHRMAMSLALVGLRVPGVVIRNPGCTAKTYPHFFRDLQSLYRQDG